MPYAYCAPTAAHISGDCWISVEAPKAGDKIFAENTTAGSGTGTIVSAEQNADGDYEALAVIKIADVEGQTLQLHDAEGPEWTSPVFYLSSLN